MTSLPLLLETMDRGIGAPVLQELRDRHGDDGSPLDWPALLERLGVVPHRGGVTFDESAPESRWRRALLQEE